MSIKSEDKFYQTFIINGVILNEMNDYHLGTERKLEDKTMAENFYLERAEWWNKQVKIEADTIRKNPSTKNVKTRLGFIKRYKDCTPILLEQIVDFLLMTVEHTLQLGHTEAFQFLFELNQKFNGKYEDGIKMIDSNNKAEKSINSKLHYSFKYKGDLRHFHKQCIEYKVLNPETSLKSFKIAFEGCDYREEKPLKWIKKQENHVVYLFDLLLKKKLIHNKIFINDKYIDVYSDVTIGALIGKTNKQVSSTRSSWKILDKNATPENSDFIRNLVDTLVL